MPHSSRSSSIRTRVGYDTVGLRGDGEAKGLGPSFINVGTDPIKLKDLIVTGYGPGEGESTGVSCKRLDGAGRQEGNEFFWWDFDYSEGAPRSGTEGVDWCYGWYSVDCATPYNDNDLTAGIGMWIYSASATYTVNFKSPIQKDAARCAVVKKKKGKQK